MTGRQERDEVMEIKINNYVVGTDNLIKKYMKSIKRTKTTRTRYVYATYLVSFNNFLVDNGIKLVDVRPMDIDEYIDYISYNKEGEPNKPQIINARLSAIISFYDFLVENKLIKDNPCSRKKKLKVEEKQTVTYMTADEVRKIKAVIQNGKGRYKKYISRDIAIVDIGCCVGLRVSAITNINIEDIDFDDNSIVVTEKGNVKRTIYFGENTKKCILDWMTQRNAIMGNNSGALFISKNKQRMSNDAVNDMLHNATRMAGIDKKITAHKMRSTCAMNLYAAKGDIYLVQQQLGHKNINNTMIYAKATNEQKREVATLLDTIY